MAKHNRPRRGSMAFRPRGRAKGTPRVNAWPLSEEKGLLGFAGYKAGMTHVHYIDDTQSHKKGLELFTPVTVVETPPLGVYGIRFFYMGQVVKDVLTDNVDFLKELKFNKLAEAPRKDKNPEVYDDVYVLVYAQPKKSGMSKKTVERFDIAVGGKTKEDKLEYAESVLGKEVTVADVIKSGEFLDIVAVTKGKGWQGTVKRFGTKIQRRKATGRYRHIGCLGTFHPGYVQYTIPMAGQMGFHKRTEINKRVMKIGDKADPITPVSGFNKYGVVKNDYLLIKGSLAGARKRLIKLRKSIRSAKKTIVAPQVTNISRRSQQL